MLNAEFHELRGQNSVLQNANAKLAADKEQLAKHLADLQERQENMAGNQVLVTGGIVSYLRQHADRLVQLQEILLHTADRVDRLERFLIPQMPLSVADIATPPMSPLPDDLLTCDELFDDVMKEVEWYLKEP